MLWLAAVDSLRWSLVNVVGYADLESCSLRFFVEVETSWVRGRRLGFLPLSFVTLRIQLRSLRLKEPINFPSEHPNPTARQGDYFDQIRRRCLLKLSLLRSSRIYCSFVSAVDFLIPNIETLVNGLDSWRMLRSQLAE
jgi:hypothetical protein